MSLALPEGFDRVGRTVVSRAQHEAGRQLESKLKMANNKATGPSCSADNMMDLLV